MRIAVFDLDGTITRRDTLRQYLDGWRRRRPRRGFLPRAVVALLRFPADRDPGRLKAGLIRAAMSGATHADVAAWTAEFVAALGERELCPGALAAIEGHRAAGDRLVLLSASVDLYVPEIGRRLGFDESICTGIAWRDGRLDGALSTPNRRGPEKRRCIERLRAHAPGVPCIAYANAREDFDHFEAADEAVLVNAGPSLRRQAESRGWRTADWR
jgi:phosphatidylglycerophosphatase C